MTFRQYCRSLCSREVLEVRGNFESVRDFSCFHFTSLVADLLLRVAGETGDIFVDSPKEVVSRIQSFSYFYSVALP